MGILWMDPSDNVVIATEDIGRGTAVEFGTTEIVAADDIKRGHKMAIRPIAKNAAAIKYGEKIGLAFRDIGAGEWVHTHNLADVSVQMGKAFAAKYRGERK